MMMISTNTVVEIRFHQLIYSLSKEGYLLRLCVELPQNGRIAKLIHNSNGNVIMLKADGRDISLWKNGKLKKKETIA